jgi:hypothetical protein
MNPANTPLRQRRGCEWHDFGNAIGIVVARAPAKDVAAVLAKQWGGNVETVDPVHKPQEYPDMSGVVFRHAGHDWSVFISGGGHDDELARDLSKALRTRVLSLAHEDTAGWTELRVFDAGDNVETYTYGPDYADEVATMAEEMGEEFGEEGPAIMTTDAGRPWDHQVKQDGNDFRFRSTLRKVAASSVTDEKRTLDETFKASGAWLPGWAHLPWADPTEHPDQPESEFAEAFVVRRAS